MVLLFLGRVGEAGEADEMEEVEGKEAEGAAVEASTLAVTFWKCTVISV